MIVSVVDERVIWFLFPGRKTVTEKGSLIEGGQVVCWTKTRREAKEALRVLEVFSEDPLVVCQEVGDWLDLSTWNRVYQYMVEVLKFPDKKKVAQVFEEAKEEDSVLFTLKFLAEAVVIGTWPTRLLQRQVQAYQLLDQVAMKHADESLKIWYEINDPGLCIAVLAKLAARARGKIEGGSNWSQQKAVEASRACNFEYETWRVMAEPRFPERFTSLALLFSMLRLGE